MKLYCVYNGYTGFDAVRVLVVAADEQRAIELARQTFAREQPNNPNYSANLTAELLFADLTNAQCSEVVG